MKKAKIAELRNGLSRYLDHVRAGGSVIVYDRDTPIAEIVPLKRSKTRSKEERDEERLARLERRGAIIRPTGDLAAWLKTHKPIKIPGGLPASCRPCWRSVKAAGEILGPSALVPLFIEEVSTTEVQRWQPTDPGITTWMMTRVEVLRDRPKAT